MKTLIAATLILLASLAGAETKAKQSTDDATQLATTFVTSINPVMTVESNDHKFARLTFTLNVQGLMVHGLAHTYSGVDEKFQQVCTDYDEAVKEYTMLLGVTDADYSKLDSMAEKINSEGILLIIEAKGKK